MKFVAKERKTIDAVRWTGSNVVEVVEWARSIGISITQDHDNLADGLAWRDYPGDAQRTVLVAYTLHGDLVIEPGVWVAYAGTDVYPLADSELQRLYDPVVLDVVIDDDMRASMAEADEDDAAGRTSDIDDVLAEFGGADLGLASTRQLLREVQARLDSEKQGAGEQVAFACMRALELLPEEILEYRTVEG